MGSHCFKDADNYVRQVDDEGANSTQRKARRGDTGAEGDHEGDESLAALRKLTDAEIQADPKLRAAAKKQQRKRERFVEFWASQVCRLENRLSRRNSEPSCLVAPVTTSSGTIPTSRWSTAKLRKSSRTSTNSDQQALVGSPSRRRRAGIYAAEYVSNIRQRITKKRRPSSQPGSPAHDARLGTCAQPFHSEEAISEHPEGHDADRWNGLSSGLRSSEGEVEFFDNEDSIFRSAPRARIPPSDAEAKMPYVGGANPTNGQRQPEQGKQGPAESPDLLEPTNQKLSEKVRNLWGNIRARGHGIRESLNGLGPNKGEAATTVTHSGSTTAPTSSSTTVEFVRYPPRVSAATNVPAVVTNRPDEWIEAKDLNP